MYYIHTNLPVSVIVRLPHPQNRDSQGQLLAPSTDNHMCNIYIYIILYIYILYIYIYIWSFYALLNEMSDGKKIAKR